MNGTQKTGKVRIVERAGPKMSTLLSNRTPWKKERCGREDCPPCETKPGSCRTLNPVYKITCLDCASIGKQTHYIGESSRSLYDRTREHVQALRDKNAKYAVTKHWLEAHKDLENPPKYQFKVLGSYLTAIQRQISEGLAIESHDPETLINGKGEYGSNRIPRYQLTIEGEILGKHGQTYNQSNSDQPQIPTESSSTSHKRNNDTDSGNLFLE